MPNSGAKGVEKVGLFALAPIVGLFFLWGVANNLNDVLIAQFRKAFSLGDLQSGLVQSAFYLGYFLFALPAALFMRRMGFKAAVVLGLVLYGAGALLFYPAAESRTYGAFLAPVRDRRRPRLPGDLGQSADPGHGIASGRHAAPQSGAGLQSAGVDHRRPDRASVHLLRG